MAGTLPDRSTLVGTKRNPGEFDCYRNAELDEPMFVLLARDIDAPNTVREWALARWAREGIDAPPSAQVREALQCAEDMYVWRNDHR